jgi:hypothetical protein
MKCFGVASAEVDKRIVKIVNKVFIKAPYVYVWIFIENNILFGVIFEYKAVSN